MLTITRVIAISNTSFLSLDPNLQKYLSTATWLIDHIRSQGGAKPVGCSDQRDVSLGFLGKTLLSLR